MDPTKIHKYFKDQIPPKISELKTKFKDPYFPPNINSLQSRNSKGEYIDKENGEHNAKRLGIEYAKGLTWKRGTTEREDMKIFDEKIHIKEISQGSLGDCYFLSSLAALSTLPYLLREKFRLSQVNKFGYIEVILFIDGEWQIVFLDDYFPYDSYHFCFAHPYENIFWAVILEKAWAKINGGYSNIIGGLCSDPIEVLTGFPCTTIYNSSHSSQELYKVLEEGNSKKLMTVSTGDVDERCGLAGNHAYTVIQAKKWEEKGIYLVMIRNPWGHGEWNGKWSDQSDAWTPELINYFKMVKKEDGIFWMDINDYKKYFEDTEICHLMFDSIVKNYHFNYEKYFLAPNVFNFRLRNKGTTSIRAIFKQKRFNRNLKNEKRPFIMILGQYNTNKQIIKTYSNYQTYGDTVDFVRELDEGYYVLWTYVNYSKISNKKDFSYSLQITSENQTNLICEYMGLDSTFAFTQYLLLNSYENEEEGTLSRNKGSYKIGYPTVSGITGSLIFNLNDTKRLNCTISCSGTLFPPYNSNSDMEISIPPNQKTAIIGFDTYSVSLSTYFSNDYKGQLPSLPNDVGFLNFQLSNDISDIFGIRTYQYKYISQRSIWEIPAFQSNEFIEISKEMLRKSSLTPVQKIDQKVDLKTLLSNYKKELELMVKEFPPRESDKNIKIRTDKIDSNSGTFIGEIKTENERFHGRGIFIWTNGMKYVGYWTNGEMDTRGIIYNKENNKLYSGEFKKGKREGKGEIYYPDNEKYVGTLKNDKREGIGIYYFSNGSSWKGKFVNDMKNGIGLFTKKDGGKLYVEFEKDHIIGRYDYKGEDDKFPISDGNDNLNNLIKKKTEIINNIDVKTITVNEKKNELIKNYNLLLNRIKDLNEKEPFMVNKALGLNSNNEDFLTLINEYGIKYLGGINTEKKKNGRGVLFKGNKYYVGFFNNDLPIGIFDIYDEKMKKKFSGEIDNNCNFKQNSNITVYYSNGNIYNGQYSNNNPNGFGTLYFEDNSSWCGNFINGKFEGDGKFFFLNGCISQIVKYKENNIISIQNPIIDDYSTNSDKDFFSKIKNKEIKNRLLTLNSYRESSELKYVNQSLPNHNEYYGQVDKNNLRCGKGCIIYNNAKERYLIGYFKNNEIDGEITTYNVNWDVIYKGTYKNGKKNGFGILYHSRGVYIGEFYDNLPNGKGVFDYQNDIRYEGYFLKGMRHGRGYLVNLKENIIQEFLYCKNNIIEEKPKINCLSTTYKNQKSQNLNMLNKLYPDYLKSILSFKESDESLLLRFTSFEDDNGYFYLGEVNNIGFKQGRGILIYPNKKRRYIGNFNNNMKNGQGAIFSDEKNKEYVGNFLNDKMSGEGIYYLKNGNKIKGNFNEIGEGNGEILFTNNERWNGNFYGLFMDGDGNCFDSNGKKTGQKSYNLENTFK